MICERRVYATVATEAGLLFKSEDRQRGDRPSRDDLRRMHGEAMAEEF